MSMSTRSGALAAAVALVSSALPATPSFAASDESVIEEVVVTGSRIARKNEVGPSPVLEFQREDILKSGRTSLGEIIREIPSVAGAGQTTQINNGGTGAQTISLRGLGSDRTLVLLNGRRLPASATTSSSTGVAGIVDLNTIPISMVERVEVLQDGASAVYGSDAIAGVVNIITRRDFEGVEINTGYGSTTHSDGERTDVSVTFGNTYDGGHFMFDATYVNEQKILAGDRDWAATPLASLGGDVIFLGSSAPPWGNYGLSTGSVTLGPDFQGGTGPAGFRPFDFFGGDSYNFAPINNQRQPNKRYMFTFTGEQALPALSNDFTGDVRVFAEAQYVNRKSKQALAEVPLAPAAFFGFTATYSADNFYNPFGEDIVDWRRRMVEGGPRTDPNQVETKRILVGLSGDKNDWTWEAYYSLGEVDLTNNFGDIYNLQRVANAVGPTTGSPATGDLQCVNDPANCVPLNVFGQNSVTQEMLDYITFRTNEAAGQEQQIWSFNVSNGNLYDLPAGPIGIAFGFEYRKEEGFDKPDSQVAALADAGATTGTPRKPTDGGYDVKEFYAEVIIPVLADLPGVKDLELTVAHRYSDYDSFGSTNNTKFGVQYRPIDDLMIRATVSEAFRAPQISDLFGGSGTSFPALTDPCSTNPTPFCVADGVPAGGYTPLSTQIRTQVGGNPNLQPETADEFTVGIVYTPTFWEPLNGLGVTVDFYDIELKDAIAPIGADFILDSCASSGLLCDRITRFTSGPLQGNINNLDNRTGNVGGVDLRGLDISLRYNTLETRFGNFDFRLEGSYIDQFDVIQVDGSKIPHAGRFIDDQAGWFGRWKTNFNLRYTWRDLTFNYDLRWIKGANETYTDFALGPLNRNVSSRWYNDLQVTYDVRVYDATATFTVGVENLFDRDPPLSLDGFNDNTDVRTFDTQGRYVYGRLTYRM